MSSQKLALILISCIAVAAVAGFLIWFFIYRKTTEKGSQDFTTVSDKFIPAAKEALGLADDDKVKMLVAGLNVFKSLSDEDFKNIKKITDEEKLKEALKKVEESKSSIKEFLKLDDKEKIKEKSSLKPIKYLVEVIKETVATIDISKKADAPYKEIIERIQKENEKQKDILAKAIAKYNANIVEIVVCNTDSFVSTEQDFKNVNEATPAISTEKPETTTNPITIDEEAGSAKASDASTTEPEIAKNEPTSSVVPSSTPEPIAGAPKTN